MVDLYLEWNMQAKMRICTYASASHVPSACHWPPAEQSRRWGLWSGRWHNGWDPGSCQWLQAHIPWCYWCGETKLSLFAGCPTSSSCVGLPCCISLILSWMNWMICFHSGSAVLRGSSGEWGIIYVCRLNYNFRSLLTSVASCHCAMKSNKVLTSYLL